MRETCLYTTIYSFFACQTVRHLMSRAVCWGCCAPTHPRSHFARANLRELANLWEPHAKFPICRLYSAGSAFHGYQLGEKKKRPLFHYLLFPDARRWRKQERSELHETFMSDVQGQKHADKLLLSCPERHQQFCGNCSAKFLKIKMLLLWFFHFSGKNKLVWNSSSFSIHTKPPIKLILGI